MCVLMQVLLIHSAARRNIAYIDEVNGGKKGSLPLLQSQSLSTALQARTISNYTSDLRFKP